ncbi:MAG TPA: helix-turn-helix domain-containing protein [Acidimicrobiia bacterium]|nr:helix-turn-helix domain-containing protein [Acidimicrobiia bacterium]
MNENRNAETNGRAAEPGTEGLDDHLLTSAEVASLFGVDRRTVVLWAKRGRIRALRTPGGQHRFRAVEIRGLLERHEGGNDAPDHR